LRLSHLRLPCGQRLSADEFAVERRVLGQVADEHVSSSAGQTRPPDRLGGELAWELRVESFEFAETREHLAVARRVRSSAGDDVAAVLAMFARGPEELQSLAQCIAERVSERDCVAPRESELVAVDRYTDVGTVRRDCCLGVRDAGLTPGEFLDQERGYSVSYTETLAALALNYGWSYRWQCRTTTHHYSLQMLQHQIAVVEALG
jgi:hypothetical protein